MLARTVAQTKSHMH